MSAALRRLPLAFLVLAPSCGGCQRGGPAARFHEGDAYVYRVQLSSSAQVAASPTPVAFELTGELVLRPHLSGGSTTFVARVRGPAVRATGDAGAEVSAELAGDLEGLWGFDLVDGRAQSLWLRPGAKPLTVAIFSTLAAAFQAPGGAPEGGGWRAEEVDGTGRYQARYTRGPEPGGFTRTKLSYRTRALPLSAVPLGAMDWSPVVIASTTTLRLRGDDLARSSSHEELEVALTPTSRVHSITDLDLTLGEHGAGPGTDDWPSLRASTAAVTIGDPILSDQPTRAYDARLATGVTFDQALAALEQESPHGSAAPDVTAAQRQLGAFSTMVAVLRSRPEDVPRALEAIERGSPVQSALLDALGSAGGAEAQAALVQEMSRPGAPEARRREAAFALIRTPHPTEPSVGALVGALGDTLVRSHAVHGLGTYARRLREGGDAALANRAADALLAELARATHSSARVEVLRGLANSGDARALAAVRPLLDDPDVSIRAAAIDAIRLMPDPEVDALLARGLALDEDANVRIEALEAAALRRWSGALSAAVAVAAESAPDMLSRLRAVSVLERWLPARPELRAVLERVAHTDSREAVRKAAKGALGT